jgi:hypothetical protein
VAQNDSNIDFRTPLWLIKYLTRSNITKESDIPSGILLCPSRKLHYPLLGSLDIQLHFFMLIFYQKLTGFRQHLILKRNLVSEVNDLHA